MAKHIKRPKAGAAWSMTLAAALDLFAFVFLAKADASLRSLILFGACELMFIVIATGTWKKYFEELIDFRIDQSREGHEIQSTGE